MPGIVWLAGIAAAVASIVVYADVLHAYFWNDDFVWLYLLHDRPLVDVLLTPQSGHTFAARNLAFAVLDRAAGMNPVPYFATMLATHALNVVLLSRLLWLTSGSAALAALGALAWGTCPTAGETLGWYSAYGQVAATTCMLLALLRVARPVRDGRAPGGRDLLVAFSWLGLGNLFFGTALAVALALPAAVAILVPPSQGRPRAVLGAAALLAAVVVSYVALRWAATVSGSPAGDDDTLRLLSEAPELAGDAFAQLLRVGVASLVLGAWWDPSRVTAGGWAPLAAAFAGCVVVLSVAASDMRRVFGCYLLLALVVYAVTATTRGPALIELLHQTAVEVGATSRYHYAAQALLAVAACAGLAAVAARWPRGVRAAVPCAVAALLVGLVRHPVVVDLHEETRRQVTKALHQLHMRVALDPPGSTVIVDNRRVGMLGWMPSTTIPLPGLAALFVIAYPSDDIVGRRVRFREGNPDLLRTFTARPGRLADVLVPRE